MPRDGQLLACGFPGCGRSYQRKEHLTRHQMNHFHAHGDETQQRISAYFANFHPTWPFLHKEMFAPDREPALLLQSVVMVGLWTKQDDASRHAAARIHEKLVASISEQRGGWDVSAPANQPKSNPEPWPVGTYQGILLNIIFAMLSGAESTRNSLRGTFKLDLKPGQKVALSESNYELLVALVKSALQRGMFSNTDMFAHYSSRSRNIIFVWIGVEEVKRFALTLFKVWSMCERDAATGNEELLSARDLNFSMPEREDLWDAPSHEELVLRLEADVREGKCAQNDVENWISNQLGGKRNS
ncbi:hypothetical protein SLS56_000678 [Neofusicoccum ribis]|uniref:C2H2-type domain-containing protein n=1 Tax=Neofusicoccum ribis TaxID=45134 RepID=A0ABR3TDA8_9PEZI